MDRKMPHVVLSQYLLLISLISTVHCAIQLQYDSEQCLGELVEYQCTVTDLPNFLVWRVLQENGTQLGIDVTYTTSSTGNKGPDTRGSFTFDRLSYSPTIISNVTFTVQSSINRYTIICQDINTNNENLTIQIADPPPPPSNLSLSFNQNENVVNWTPPSYTSQCVSIASYTVNTTSTIITSTTDTSVTIPLAGLSPGIYCVSVASVDTANRTGAYSEKKCQELSPPDAPYLNYTSFDGTTRHSAIVQITWDFDEVTPPLLNVRVSENVTNNVTVIPADDDSSLFTITRGIDYLFTVFGENIVANGPASELLINVGIDEELPPPPTPEPTNRTDNNTMNTTNTNNTTNSGGSPNDDSGPSVIVIVIPIVVIVIILLIVIVIVIVIIYCKKKNKSVNPDKNSGEIELKKTEPVPAHNDQSYYADLEIADTKASQKKAAGRGRGSSQPASATNYSAMKHEVVYTDVSHSVPAGKKPTPTPTVNYSAVTH